MAPQASETEDSDSHRKRSTADVDVNVAQPKSEDYDPYRGAATLKDEEAVLVCRSLCGGTCRIS